MVKQDAVAGVQAVGFAVVDGDPVAVDLGGAVGTARVEGSGFPLGDFPDLAEHFAGGGLIKAGLALQAENADAFEQAQRAKGVGVGGVFGGLERDLDVALRGEVVDFVGLGMLENADQVGGVGEVAVVQGEAPVGGVRVLVEVINALGVELRGAALDAVDGVALVQQEFGQIGAVLAGDAGDECGLGHGATGDEVAGKWEPQYSRSQALGHGGAGTRFRGSG